MEPLPNKPQSGKKVKASKKEKLSKKSQKMKIPNVTKCTHVEMEHLGGKVSEFLDAYIILGYDLQGNAISIYAAKNQQHVDGLSTLIQNAVEQQFTRQHPPFDD